MAIATIVIWSSETVHAEFWRAAQFVHTKLALHVCDPAHPALVTGSQTRQRPVPPPSERRPVQTRWMPSVQSAFFAHGVSATQAPLAAQSGPATFAAAAHWASDAHARQTLETQMGVFGTSPQPRV